MATTLNDAINALKDLWGISQVAPDADGRYKFLFEGGLSFEIQPQGAKEAVLVAGIKKYPMGELPPEAELTKFLQYAGARIGFDCGKLSWERQQTELIWCAPVRWSEMEKSDWLQIAENFLNSLEFWVKVGENDERGSAPASPFVIMP
ncbi:MAG TPA: type III secretion system chaperone [Opitutales bacterium]|nr:type III secretion system chaperone [Opitutales bacterium]